MVAGEGAVSYERGATACSEGPRDRRLLGTGVHCRTLGWCLMLSASHRCVPPQHPPTVELFSTLGALPPRGGPVQDPVITHTHRSPFIHISLGHPHTPRPPNPNLTLSLSPCLSTLEPSACTQLFPFRTDPWYPSTGVPRLQEPSSPYDPTAGLCLGSLGGPRGVSVFLLARYPCTLCERSPISSTPPLLNKPLYTPRPRLFLKLRGPLIPKVATATYRIVHEPLFFFSAIWAIAGPRIPAVGVSGFGIS